MADKLPDASERAERYGISGRNVTVLTAGSGA